MKLIGLLSWYDENPAWLSSSIISFAQAGMDHLVAVDGAYALLPGGKAASGFEQHEAILETCRTLGIGLTLHVPDQPWEGNEVEKRTFLFRLGQRFARARKDWFVVIDADEVVVKAPNDLKALLKNAEDYDAATVTFIERRPKTKKAEELAAKFKWEEESRFPIRIIFRTIPGIKCEGNHYTYVTPDGRTLWGNETVKGIAPALDLKGLFVVDHRTNFRSLSRADRQKDYYKTRDKYGIELGTCSRCASPAVEVVPEGWEPHPDGLAAGWSPVCALHKLDVEAEGRAIVKRLGYTPEDMTLTHRKVEF